MGKSQEQPFSELNELTLRLAEAEEALRAIRSGEVDAIVVSGPDGNQIWSVSNAETTYFSFIHEMSEGAATLSREGIILFCNSKFAELVNEPIERITGTLFRRFILPEDYQKFDALRHNEGINRQDDVRILTNNSDQEPICVKLSISPCIPHPGGNMCILVATDISFLKKKERELFEKEELLQQQLKEIDSSRLYTMELLKDTLEAKRNLDFTNQKLIAEITERERAEEESRRSREHFQAIFEQAPLGIALVDSVSGKLININNRYAEIVGRTREEVLSSDWMSITHPDDLQEDLDNMARLNAGEIHDFRMNKRYFKPDGSLICISLTVSSILDTDSSHKLHLGMIEDITDRVREEQLLTSKMNLIQFSVDHTVEELLDEILNEAEKLTDSQISFVNFPDEDQESFKLQTWSNQTKTIYCKPQEQNFHNPLSEAGVWSDCVRLREPVIHNDYNALPHRKGLPAGHPEIIRELVFPVLRGDKITTIMGVGNKPSDYNKQDLHVIELFANLSWELSERMRVQQQLKESELKYTIVADNANDWEFWRAPNGQYLYQSPSCKRITGYDAKEFLNDTELIIAITHPDDRESFAQHRYTVESKQVPSKAEFKIITREGEIKWIDHVCQPVFDTDGKFMGTRGSNRDITDRKRAEHEIQQLNQTLEERVAQRTEQLEGTNKELESFSYSISHDLRAPLRAISGFSQILSTRHRESLNEQGREYLDYIVEASFRMEQLINDLLEYSRLGRRSLNLRPVQLSEIIDNIYTDFESRLNEIGAKIYVSKELPDIYGEESLLRQIFSNLIENAINYRRKEVPLEIRIDSEKDDRGYVIKISDNGIGIPAEYYDKIFNVFQRLHNDDEYPGTGIGLSTVRKALGMMNGTIRVESTVGEGSTFIINLTHNKTF